MQAASLPMVCEPSSMPLVLRHDGWTEDLIRRGNRRVSLNSSQPTSCSPFRTPPHLQILDRVQQALADGEVAIQTMLKNLAEETSGHLQVCTMDVWM